MFSACLRDSAGDQAGAGPPDAGPRVAPAE